MKITAAIFMFIVVNILAFSVSAQKKSENHELVYKDDQGIIRWVKDDTEVALFGANYSLPSSSDYRAAGYLTDNRKALIDEDMAHFARMGWNGIRICIWGDWENTDIQGNLLENDHLDLVDYLIYRAKQRGVYILLTPVTTYNALWPDAMGDTASVSGFSRYYKKSELGTNPKAIAAQVNYIQQLLNHVNPYTGVALKNEPDILFIEMINEPWHHSDDVQGSVNYINALVDAVRNTGCQKLTFHNLSQDFNMAGPISKSEVDGCSFAWYPSGLNRGFSLRSNYLRTVDNYPDTAFAKVKNMPRIVYEFDMPDVMSGYHYPAMVRTFRTFGVQFAAMFSYDMLKTAPWNLGWQTHCLNMVYTPSKAASAIIAARVMNNYPLYQPVQPYPVNKTFGDCLVSYVDDLSVMNTPEDFLYSNNTTIHPREPQKLKQIVGYGSSPVVAYEGKGIYFFDKIKNGVWRLEVYPDAMQVNDPFNMPNPEKLVFRAIYREWPMEVILPGLGHDFLIKAINKGNHLNDTAVSSRFFIHPGVYLLYRPGSLPGKLPENIGKSGFREFISPQQQQYKQTVSVFPILNELPYGDSICIQATVIDSIEPATVCLNVRPAGQHWFVTVPMVHDRGYTWQSHLQGNYQPGLYEYCITVGTPYDTLTYPGAVPSIPGMWDFYELDKYYSFRVLETDDPLVLFNPEKEDYKKLLFSRSIERWQIPNQVIPGNSPGELVYRFGLPEKFPSVPQDITASLFIGDRIEAICKRVSVNSVINFKIRAGEDSLHVVVTLVEKDGTAWSSEFNPLGEWNNFTLPLDKFALSNSVMLPQGYPGNKAYWLPSPEYRHTMKPENIEKIQFSLRDPVTRDNDGQYFIDIGRVSLSPD